MLQKELANTSGEIAEFVENNPRGILGGNTGGISREMDLRNTTKTS